MSCNSCNDCGQVDSCVEQNDCYDNCGCPNPNTFNCTTYTGETLPNVPVSHGETGDEILKNIDTEIGKLKGNKVAADATDTCPASLVDKLTAGSNIAIDVVGTGCEKKVRITSSTGGVIPDVNVKVSATDSTSNYLNNKIANGAAISKSIVNPGANEQVKLDVHIDALISQDTGNQLMKGGDGKLKTSYTAPDGTATKVVQGTGVTVTGNGSVDNPYVINTNTAIQATKSCFDGVWRDITLANITNPNVTKIAGAPKYRIRFDGTIEFKGSLTFITNFGNYSSSSRKFTFTIGNIPMTCLNSTEQSGVSDLKAITYIDDAQASADQFTQMYGYVIRKSTQNIIIELSSAFTNATQKTIVVNFDGAISHPNI